MAEPLADVLAHLVEHRWAKLVHFARVKLRHPEPEDLVMRTVERMLRYAAKKPPLRRVQNVLFYEMRLLANQDGRYGEGWKKRKPVSVPYNEVVAARRAYPMLHGRRVGPKKGAD